jgi:dienelactone hydrolase
MLPATADRRVKPLVRLETIAIASGERTLYGVLEAPDTEPVGGVVLVHGWGGCRVGPHRILVDAARRLAALGLATLRFDIGGRGESTGDPLATDLDAMIDDASAAAAALCARLPEGLPVAFLGMCSGGNVALAAAGMRDDIAAVATWSTYPFQEQGRAADEVRRRRTGHFLKVYLGKALRPATWGKLFRGAVNFRMIGRVLFGHYRKGEGTQRDLQRSQRDVLTAVRGYAERMLFLYGASDPEAAGAQEAFEEFCAENGLQAEFDAIEGANHNFYSLEWKAQAIDRTAEWLAAAVQA